MRLFDHVQRRAINASTKNSEFLQVEVMNKGRERPKITSVEVVKDDISIKEVTKSMTSNKIEKRKRIHVTNPD